MPSRTSISTIAPGSRAIRRTSCSSPNTALEKSTPENPAPRAARARSREGTPAPTAALGGRPGPRAVAADRRGRLLPAGELRLEPTLPYDRVATHAQERQQVLDHLAERTHGARGRYVVALTTRLCEQLRAFVAHLDVR